jgi:hypothetical protein
MQNNDFVKAFSIQMPKYTITQIDFGNADSVLQLELCFIAGEVPLDRYNKGKGNERV